MKHIIVYLLFAIILFGCQSSDENSLNIIPFPVEAELLKGEYVFTKNTQISLLANDPEIERIATLFANRLNEKSGLNINVNQKGEQAILFILENNHEKFGDEGYALEITKKGIKITAHKPAGLFYATQTIYQLLPLEFNSNSVDNLQLIVPAVRIFDKPRFGWRGNMLDPSRHFIDIGFIKQNLDYLATLKMNHFHWHLTDDQGWRIEIRSLPNLTETGAWRVDRNDQVWWGRESQQPGEEAAYGGYYTHKQIEEIVQYAKDRFITIIPEIDMPGHSQAALASYPEISCDGGPYYVATGGVAKDNTYCPGKEITFDFVAKVIDEVVDLFPSEYIHIGGDECNKEAWMECEDCQNRIKSEGLIDEHGLQSYFITRVEELINSKGKKMIGWDEILEGGLAPNATVMSWRGEAGGIESVKAGHDVVMSPNSYCYLDLKQGDPEIEPDLGYGQLLLKTVYLYNPVPEELSKEEADHILGIQGNLWGESMQNPDQLNYMLFPRMFALAEVAWSPQDNRSLKQFIPRMEHALERLDIMDINYAKSAYNVSIDIFSEPENGVFAFGLSTEVDNIEIRYTLDGSEPGIDSYLYNNPVKIDTTTTINAVSVKDGGVFGKTSVKTITLHRAAGKKVVLKTGPAEKYNPGAQALTDCLRGSRELFNKNWLGFEGEDLNVTIDLGGIQEINRIVASFLHNPGSWIYLPREIEFFVSDNGVDFKLINSIDNSEQENLINNGILEFSSDQIGSARFIRVNAKNYGGLPDHHPGAGSPAWLFVDEILVLL